MPKARDWIKDVQGTDITFISNEGNHIKCSYEGFTFLVRRANWPPKRLTAEVCEDPTGFYVYQCQKVHGNKYDLSSVVYTKADSKIKVYCPVHGVFEIRAAAFKGGKGCRMCGRISSADRNRKSTQEFIAAAKLVHGELYNYSLTEYCKAKQYVDIICPEHGVFKQTPTNHLAGKGCRLCALSSSSYQSFITSSNKSGKALLYIIKCYDETETFIKIGITSKSIQERFQAPSKLPYHWQELYTFQGEAREIVTIEQELHSLFRGYRYVPNKSFNGQYECYIPEIENLILRGESPLT